MGDAADPPHRALLAFAAGGWLIVSPILYGPGGLILYFAGYALALFSRRTVVQDTQIAEPQTQRTVSPGT